MRTFFVVLLSIVLWLFLLPSPAQAVTLEEAMWRQQAVMGMHRAGEISEAAHTVFSAAYVLYQAYHEAGSQAREIRSLIEESQGMAELEWQQRGELAGQALALFESLRREYDIITAVLLESQLWSPAGQELEVLLFAREMLTAIDGNRDTGVDNLGLVWEQIANSYKDAGLKEISFTECPPRFEGLAEEEAESLFINFARWTAVNYQWLLVSQERYARTKWAFLEGEGLLVDLGQKKQQGEPESDRGSILVAVGIGVLMGGSWFTYRTWKRRPV
ncbi:MAG: hypothetical protein GX750_07945 [Clostridia bacterium]|nr:hypothetical protein [Clostridia bacterium]